jgi:hypothetical protein
MTARNTVWPRGSIAETDGALGAKPRNPLEDGLGADLKSRATDAGFSPLITLETIRKQQWAGLGIRVQLHASCPFKIGSSG